MIAPIGISQEAPGISGAWFPMYARRDWPIAQSPH